MSIHTTATGDRCPGRFETVIVHRSASAGVEPAVAPVKPLSASQRNRERQREMDPELAEAFEAARYRRNNTDPAEPKKTPNRTVYVVKGAHVVSGGLPTLERSR